MKFDKTLTDVTGDEVRVTLFQAGENPHLTVTDTVGDTRRAVAELTPAQARTLAHAAPGFMRPEGVVVYHSAGQVFKALIENDDQPKGDS